MMKRFKIVKILDEYNVIINGGLEDKLNIGDKFEILDKQGSRVYDPDTNEILGSLDLIKGTVEITELHERMSVCSSLNNVRKNNEYTLFTLSGIKSVDLNKNLKDSSRERLNVNLKQVTGGKRISTREIVLGDRVRLI